VAKQVIPGGVNSPVERVAPSAPIRLFIAQGDGAVITDLDGNQYIDMIGSGAR